MLGLRRARFSCWRHIGGRAARSLVRNPYGSYVGNPASDRASHARPGPGAGPADWQLPTSGPVPVPSGNPYGSYVGNPRSDSYSAQSAPELNGHRGAPYPAGSELNGHHSAPYPPAQELEPLPRRLVSARRQPGQPSRVVPAAVGQPAHRGIAAVRPGQARVSSRPHEPVGTAVTGTTTRRTTARRVPVGPAGPGGVPAACRLPGALGCAAPPRTPTHRTDTAAGPVTEPRSADRLRSPRFDKRTPHARRMCRSLQGR